MNFFDKLKDAVSKFTKESAELAKESVNKIGEKASVFTQANQLKVEIRGLEKRMDELFVELGGEYFNLVQKDMVDKFPAELEPTLEKIRALEEELKEKQSELQEVMQVMAKDTIDKTKVQSLKKELEEGGGTIEQIVIHEQSPVVGKKLKSVELPKEVLVGTILRDEQVLIPDGTYTFQANDKVTLLGKKKDVEEALNLLVPPREETQENEQADS